MMEKGIFVIVVGIIFLVLMKDEKGNTMMGILIGKHV